MPSKSRGGLSKREYAAQQKAKQTQVKAQIKPVLKQTQQLSPDVQKKIADIQNLQQKINQASEMFRISTPPKNVFEEAAKKQSTLSKFFSGVQSIAGAAKEKVKARVQEAKQPGVKVSSQKNTAEAIQSYFSQPQPRTIADTKPQKVTREDVMKARDKFAEFMTGITPEDKQRSADIQKVDFSKISKEEQKRLNQEQLAIGGKGAFNVMLNFVGGGSKALLKQLAKSKNVQFIESALRGKVADSLLPTVARDVANASDEKVVENIIKTARTYSNPEVAREEIKVMENLLNPSDMNESQVAEQLRTISKNLEVKSRKPNEVTAMMDEARSAVQDVVKNRGAQSVARGEQARLSQLAKDSTDLIAFKEKLAESSSPYAVSLQQNEKRIANFFHQAKTDGLGSGFRSTALNVNRLNLDDAGKARMFKETQTIIESMSNKDIQKIARSSGLDTRTYTDEQLKKKIAEQLNVRQSAVSFEAQAKQLAEQGDLAGAADMYKQSAEMGRVAREQGTGLGRELQARRILANELDTPAQRMFKLLDEAGVNPEAYAKRFAGVDFNDARQVVKAYRDLVPPKAEEWIDVIRYNSMLSSPLTHIVNIGSNAANSMVMTPLVKLIGGTFDFLASPLAKNRSIYAAESAVYLKNYIQNVGNAFRSLGRVLTGKTGITNLDLRHIPVAQGGVKGFVANTLSFPSKILEGMDQFFMTMAEAGELASLEYRVSKGAKINNIKQLAKERAAYTLFRSELHAGGIGWVEKGFDHLTDVLLMARNSKHAGVRAISKFTVPFIQTPMNIFKQGLEYTPLGFVNLIGNERKAEALAKIAIGAGTMFGISSLLANGRITWERPIGEKERQQFDQAGRIPYSIKIGDKWYSFQKLPPGLAYPIAAVAAINDALEKQKIDQNLADTLISGLQKYGTFLSDQSYAKGIGALISATRGEAGGLSQYVANTSQQLIPMRAFMGWLARLQDPMQRMADPDGKMAEKQLQYFMMQIPGLSQRVPARVDENGKPLNSSDRIWNAFIPVRKSTVDQSNEHLFQILQKSKVMKANEKITNSIADEKTMELAKQIKEKMKAGDKEGALDIAKGLSKEQIESIKDLASGNKAEKTVRFNDLFRVDPIEGLKYMKTLAPADQLRILKSLDEKEKVRLLESLRNR